MNNMVNYYNTKTFGEFDIITPASGEKVGAYVSIMAVNGNASVKAETVTGDHFCSNGNYATGNANTLPEGLQLLGRFSKITVTEGTIIAYKYFQVGE